MSRIRLLPGVVVALAALIVAGVVGTLTVRHLDAYPSATTVEVAAPSPVPSGQALPSAPPPASELQPVSAASLAVTYPDLSKAPVGAALAALPDAQLRAMGLFVPPAHTPGYLAFKAALAHIRRWVAPTFATFKQPRGDPAAPATKR